MQAGGAVDRSLPPTAGSPWGALPRELWHKPDHLAAVASKAVLATPRLETQSWESSPASVVERALSRVTTAKDRRNGTARAYPDPPGGPCPT